MARKSRKTIASNCPQNQMGHVDTANVSSKTETLATGAYIRLSVENNGHETDNSLKNQILLVETFIREHEELSLIDTYVDNGFSGTKFDRPEFVRMMDDVKSGKIQCIVVKDLSRFGRDYLETGYYLETIFPLLNVRFIAITDQFDSVREEDRNSISVPIKNMVNAMYAKDYSRKQEAFREMCKKTGRVMGVYAAYGYTFSKETRRMEIDQTVAPYVHMVFAWALAGVSRTEIAKRMNLLGAPTPASRINRTSENEWKDSTIKGILYNPIYAGFHVMNKSKVSVLKGIDPMRTGRDEWLYFPDFHEPYITMEDYNEIETMIGQSKQERTDRLKVREEIRAQMPDVFKGKVFCADCGRQMNYGRGSHHKGYKDITFQYYRCRYSKQFAKCSNKKVQQSFLKIVVMDQIRNLIQAFCDRATLLEEVKRSYAKPGALNPIERGLSRLSEKECLIEEKILRAYEDYASKLLEEDDYLAVKSKLNADKAELEQKRGELERKHAALEKTINQYESLAEHLKVFLNATEFDEGLVKELVDKIFVSDDGSVEIIFSCKDLFESRLLKEYLCENGENEDGNCKIS